MFNLNFVTMTNILNKIISSFICVDPCPMPAKAMLKASMTSLGIVLSPGGLPGKVIGGVAGYAVGSKLADKMLK